MNLSNSLSTSHLHHTSVNSDVSNPSSPLQRNKIVDRGLDIHLQNRRSHEALKWGTLNIFVLSILLFDISNKCPFAISNWYYAEYAAATLVGICMLYNFGKFFYVLFSFAPILGSVEQKRLLRFDENDKSFVTNAPKLEEPSNTGNTSLNVSHLSWHSSMNDSGRSPGRYNRGSPTLQQQQTSFNQSLNGQNTSWNTSGRQNHSSLNNTSVQSGGSAHYVSPYNNYTKTTVITDERELQKYLKGVARQEEKNLTQMTGEMNGTDTGERNSMNSFLNYCNNAAILLKTSLYQLSPTIASPNKSGSAKDEMGVFTTSDADENSEIHHRICSSGTLTQYIYNLRAWIACTILQRVDAEIQKTNRALALNTNADLRGFADIQIGKVGLDRLKKTAEVHQLVAIYVPTLPMLIPFLEMSTNQEYLVQRIKDLAKGCVLSEYRWNGGGNYNNVSWDEHLPTDSAIIFHLFCTYLDSQLPPLPQPGGRPFFNRYVVMGDKKSSDEIKAEVRNKSNCAILCTNAMRPSFNFIRNRTIHNCVQDRNSLFYVIVEFLNYMKTHNEGMLEFVNLGRSGINLLKVIGE